MNTTDNKLYESPLLTVVNIRTERGYAASAGFGNLKINNNSNQSESDVTMGVAVDEDNDAFDGSDWF